MPGHSPSRPSPRQRSAALQVTTGIVQPIAMPRLWRPATASSNTTASRGGQEPGSTTGVTLECADAVPPRPDHSDIPLLVVSSADEGSKDLEILVLRRAVGRNALKLSSRPDQRSSVCSRPESAAMATVCRLHSSRPDHRCLLPKIGYAARRAWTISSKPSITMVGGVRSDPSGRARFP